MRPRLAQLPRRLRGGAGVLLGTATLAWVGLGCWVLYNTTVLNQHLNSDEREALSADAEKTLSRSYELDPSSPVTAYNLAEVLLRRGELERARFYVGRINAVPQQVNAQSLWLAARIERRLGNTSAMMDFGRQLRDRFPQSTETLQFERGRFDD